MITIKIIVIVKVTLHKVENLNSCFFPFCLLTAMKKTKTTKKNKVIEDKLMVDRELELQHFIHSLGKKPFRKICSSKNISFYSTIHM